MVSTGLCEAPQKLMTHRWHTINTLFPHLY